MSLNFLSNTSVECSQIFQSCYINALIRWRLALPYIQPWFRGLVNNKKIDPLTTRHFPLILPTHFPTGTLILPRISAPTSFHDWGLVIRWALRLITSYYCIPSRKKDHSTMRAEPTGVLVNRGMRIERTK